MEMKFSFLGGPSFLSLEALIEHYKKNELIDWSGKVVELKHPQNSTTFYPSNIQQRVAELNKQSLDTPLKVGFKEEFEVGTKRS